MSRIIHVRVRPNARKNTVETLADGSLRISVTAVPEDGKANRAVILLLSDHLGIPKSRIILKRGGGSREKYFEILPQHQTR